LLFSSRSLARRLLGGGLLGHGLLSRLLGGGLLGHGLLSRLQRGFFRGRGRFLGLGVFGRSQIRGFVVFQVSISIGLGCWAVCGWSGPAYTFSLVNCLRANRLRGSMPLTAMRITSSGRRWSISSSERDFSPPG